MAENDSAFTQVNIVGICKPHSNSKSHERGSSAPRLEFCTVTSKSTSRASGNNNSVSAELVLHQNNLSLGKTFRYNPLLDYTVTQEYKTQKERKKKN